MKVMMNLQEAAQAMHGTLAGETIGFSGVSTDSRKLAAGELFVALQGENFDGHDYLATVRQAGAVAAVVARDAAGKYKAAGLPLV